MMMEILERSWDTEVFNEADPRAYDEFMLRDEQIIRDLIARSAAPVTVVKALHEAHSLVHLMEAFAPAKAIWMYRSFDDVVNSGLNRWPGLRNRIDKLVEDRSLAEWRGAGMTDETYETVRKHYREGIDSASATGLFWFYRNQLFFDQGLDRDARALLVRYEDLVHDNGRYTRHLADFLGIELTPAMQRVAHVQSVRKHAPPPMQAEIRALCETMQQSLDETHARQIRAQEGSLTT